ncbi:hypothetical protein H310_07213 [Aphanomyces invadans]|uniref:Fe2OG dioxygenase domain-containing protein n=1 Tax=Aphanomyces invadans TaxID=157072 RepID=A0A024U343_9STRA|nr:hypothetical protein H310_07213 [Aphanomyces invadans]ETW00645.1 hypothetical protein H310_07213 [Aphanomyces invadans]|eukprot:XP_008870780.1 hypothetical protein H310_07213 [Aphanomyces invadans]
MARPLRAAANAGKPSSTSSWRFLVLGVFLVVAAIGGNRWLTLPAFEPVRVLEESTDKSKTVIVYDNGQSSGGVNVSLFPSHVASGSALAAYLSDFIDVDGIHLANLPSTKVVADRVYTGSGLVVRTFHDFAHGDRLYLVAPGLLFVWPFVQLGHRVLVTAKLSPTEKPIVLESFSESPRVFHVHNFFTNDEADALIHRIQTIDNDSSKLQQSHVGHISGAKKVSPHRTSENAFDQVSDTAVSIRKRSFDLLRIDPYQDDMADGLQLLRYAQKQAYIAHTDYFNARTSSDWNWNPKAGGSNRFATVFLYLSNVTAGGQTVFPLSEMPPGHEHPPMSDAVTSLTASLFDDNSWEKDMVTKCSTKLASYPQKTHAVLFYSQKPNGELDPMSLHGGCPVLEGTKWAANLWVWNKRRYGLDQTRKDKLNVRFTNPTDVDVDLFWKDTKMATLPAGHSVPYSSYHGHVWTFREAGADHVLLTHTLSADDGLDQTVSLKARVAPHVDDPPVSSTLSAPSLPQPDEL